MICLLILCSVIFVPLFIFAKSQSGRGAASFHDVHILGGFDDRRSAQGVATDNHHIFLTTGLTDTRKRENIISVYDMEGDFLMEKQNASRIVDTDDRFMDFGDPLVYRNHNRKDQSAWDFFFIRSYL